MTGEMHKSEVTREAFPLHFAAADEFPGATVEPFDQYQGPYVLVPGRGRFFLTSDDGVSGRWWSEATRRVSYGFFCDIAEDVPTDAFVGVANGDGFETDDNGDPIEDSAEG